MHAISPAVAAHLATQSPERARRLRAWFAGFQPDVQDILLEKARGHAHVAVVFGERTHAIGPVAG